MKQARFSAKLDPIVFPGRRFFVSCADPVIRMQVEDYITARGGVLSVRDADYVIYNTDAEMPADAASRVMLTYIQFWLASSEFDRVQKHELVEASVAYLGSGSTFAPELEQKLFWYIRDNRQAVIDAMLASSATESIEGYLAHCRELLPDAFAKIADSGEFEDQILLDLTDELIEKATRMEKHEVKAFLLEYKRTHLSGEFVEATQQADMEKEMGFLDRNEYDWMKIFSYTTEEDGIHISGYTGSDDLVFIPEEIAGTKVTSVHIRNYFTDKRELQFYWQRPENLNSPIDMDALRKAEAGDSVFFGRYPQTKSAEMLPIEWQVLKKEDNRILVISRFCLDKAPFHWDQQPMDWENCHLRRWLNGAFYQLAFTPEEQAMIPEVTLEPAPNEKYRTAYANATQDRIFVPSIAEAAALFPDDESRIGRTTDYHQVQGYYFGGKINCWWLRTPGVEYDFVALVGNSGSIGTYGYRLDNNEYAARPAMWIEIGG